MSNSFNISDAPAIAALSLKVDTLPTSNRGNLAAARWGESSTSYLSRVNLSGSGFLYNIIANPPGTNTTTILVTIDGSPSNELALTDAETVYIFVKQARTGGITIAKTTDKTHIMFEFKTSLLIQTKVSTGQTYFDVLYAAD